MSTSERLMRAAWYERRERHVRMLSHGYRRSPPTQDADALLALAGAFATSFIVKPDAFGRRPVFRRS
jgi:hypothetical protein